MHKIKVMVVDDSNIYRLLLREVLNSDPDIEVVAHAINGKFALPRIRHYKPHIVILDYEMPEMDGLETLKEIRKNHKDVRVIMFSSHTAEGAKTTLEALKLGAVDFLQKLETSKNDESKVYIKEKLIPKIKALAKTKNYPAIIEQRRKDVLHSRNGVSLNTTFNICAIGTSTGGPMALKELLSRIPGNIKGSIVITIHMPELFTEQLAANLNEDSSLSVKEAKDGEVLKSGYAYIAPGGKHLVFSKAAKDIVCRIIDDPPLNHCKPSVNIMFNSLSKIIPSKTMAIIMTGMGTDGYDGMVNLKKAGSYLLAQKKETCLVYGMPEKPTEDGLVKDSLDIPQLASRITHLMGGNIHNG